MSEGFLFCQCEGINQTKRWGFAIFYLNSDILIMMRGQGSSLLVNKDIEEAVIFLWNLGFDVVKGSWGWNGNFQSGISYRSGKDNGIRDKINYAKSRNLILCKKKIHLLIILQHEWIYPKSQKFLWYLPSSG